MYSCNKEAKELYITVDDFKIVDNNLDLFINNSKQEIIEMKCKTSFPIGTIILVNKGIRMNTTNENILKSSSSIDTIQVDQEKFHVLFPPAYLGGYIKLSVFKDMQSQQINSELNKQYILSDNKIYSAEYEIDYEKEEISSGTSIPKIPIQLKIKKI